MQKSESGIPLLQKGDPALFYLHPLEYHQNDLCCQNHHNQRNGIGGGVGGGNVVRLGGADQRAESGGRGHTAGNRAEVVEDGKFENELAKHEAKDHGNKPIISRVSPL